MNRLPRFKAGLASTLGLLLSLLIAASASATPWKFAVTCDSRSSYTTDSGGTSSPYYNANGISPYFQNVALAISRESGLDFVLYPGDLYRGKKPVNDGAFANTALGQWLAFMEPVTGAGIPVYAIRGNHDATEVSDPAGALGNITNIWKADIAVPIGTTSDVVTQDTGSQDKLTYSFMHKGSLFVGLDEYVGGLTYDATFLNAQLSRQAVHKFVFAHQPVWNYKTDELGPAPLADDLNAGKVDLLFTGHVHSYQRIAKQGYRFEEMIIGTGGAPQDDPTLTPGDPALKVENYAGGAGGNARFGYAIITVNDDGTISTEMKFLDDPTSPASAVTVFDQNTRTPASETWKFGVLSDTQWPNSPDFKNPNVAVNIIRHINQEFINHGVKFVVQVGDLTDKPSTVAANPARVENLDIRATFAQDLYNAGIGFFPLRGNHEDKPGTPPAPVPPSGDTYWGGYAREFQRIFPQTQSGVNNQTPADAKVDTTIYGPQANTNGTFTVGGNFASESNLEGLTYSFDYNNARFVLIDQFTKPSGASHSNLDATDVDWVGTQLANRPTGSHAFVFSHKGLITENHNDNLFNSSNPDGSSNTAWPLTNTFMANLANTGVRYLMGGHDHMHNRAIVTSPDGFSKVQNIIAASDSYKFYIPPAQATFNTQAWRTRETQIAQEIFTVGYYVFTVDGPKVTAEYFAMPNGCNGDCDLTYDVIPYAGNTPTSNGLFTDPVPFTKHEAFGYSLNGKEFLVAQGGSYATVADTYGGTAAAILSGTNGSTGKDYNLRSLTKTVETGWSDGTAETASNILTLWGMTDSLATDFSDLTNANYHYRYVVPGEQTDEFALSMTYDPAAVDGATAASGRIGLATRDANGNWVNAVEKNFGGSKSFVVAPWSPGYELGTYGIDPATHTAWAVINHNNDFAVAALMVCEPSATDSAACDLGFAGTKTRACSADGTAWGPWDPTSCTATYPQTITFNAVAGKTYGNAPFGVSATSSSGLPVSFASQTPGVCTVSGSTVTIAAAGDCTIRAAQGGNSTYAAAPDVDRTITVSKKSQTITFDALAGKTYGDAPFGVNATANSGLSVGFASQTTGVCSVSGSTVTILAGGDCTIRAAQGGNGNYTSAPDVDRTFTVGQAAQTITFDALVGKTYGSAPFDVSAAASSGLAVVFASQTPGVCTVGGSTVTIVAGGNCTIRASQGGNGNYAAAADIDRSFTVSQMDQAIAVVGHAPARALFGVNFTVSATASSGLPVAITASGACSGAGSDSATIAMNDIVGGCVVAFDQGGDGSYSAAPQVTELTRSFAAKNDFDGDGRSDIGCYYPPGGNWYGFDSTDGFWQTQFGYVGTVSVTGDFDGDGKSDIGVYDPNTGTWDLMKSMDGFWQTQFGAAGTIPVVGDFDGDGKDDIGYYYPAGGNWYISKSTDGFWQAQFGYAGTIPVVGDFDGDGRDDIGCYYPTGGNWYVFQSTGGFWQTTFGYEGTIPVVGDFDGDGKSDIGCYYPAGGNWYAYKSTEGFWQTLFGYAGTEPVVGDFDGDGKSDIGCYYPAGGNWYVFKSMEGFWQTQFGYVGTIPLGGTAR